MLGLLWNIALAAVALYGLVRFGGNVLQPPEHMAGNPPAYNALFFLGFEWFAYLCPFFLVSDKRWLKRRFPRLARFRWWNWLFCVVVLFAIDVVFVAAISLATNAAF